MTKRTKRILAMMSSKPKLRKISGLPPLTYTAKEEGTLKNYRIYGQTVDGESVGDRTGNLFDGAIEQGTISADGTLRDVSNRVWTKNFTVLDAGTYTIQSSNNVGEISVFIFTYTDDGTFIERLPSDWIALPYSFTLSERAKVKIVFEYTRGEAINPSDVKNIMLNVGSTALPYEPYGYKVPVTVEGKNLAPNADWVEGYITGAGGIAQPSPSNQEITSPFVKVIPGKTYVFSYYPNEGEPWRAVCYYAEDKRFIKRQSAAYSASSVAFTVESGVGYVRFSYRSYGDGTFSQLELGDTATDYEPYHAPVTTPIYLPEPIKMVGDEAEYIEYGTQKMYRIGADDLDVTLPALPTVTGTNVLSVGTEVQPSEVEVTGRIRPVPTGGGE